MKTNLKWFSIFCVTVFFFTACGKKDSDSTAVRGPKPGAEVPAALDKTKTKEDQRATKDISKLTGDEKTKVEAAANDMNQLFGMLSEASGMYKNELAFVWKPSVAKPSANVFETTYNILLANYNASGYELDLSKAPACDQFKFEVLKTPTGLILSGVSCADGSKYPMVSLRKTSTSADQPTWTLKFSTEKDRNLAASIGRFLSCSVATTDDCKVDPPECQLVGNGKKVNQSIECRNLGQDKDDTSTEYVKVTKLLYNRAQVRAQISGIFYSNLGVERANKAKFEGLDVPTRDEFNVTNSDSDSAVAKAAADEAAASTATAAGTATASQAADSNSSAAPAVTPAIPAPSDSGTAAKPQSDTPANIQSSDQPVNVKTAAPAAAATPTTAADNQEQPGT